MILQTQIEKSKGKVLSVKHRHQESPPVPGVINAAWEEIEELPGSYRLSNEAAELAHKAAGSYGKEDWIVDLIAFGIGILIILLAEYFIGGLLPALFIASGVPFYFSRSYMHRKKLRRFVHEKCGVPDTHIYDNGIYLHEKKK